MRRRKLDRGEILKREIAKGWESVAVLEMKIRKLYEKEQCATSPICDQKISVSKKLDLPIMVKRRCDSLQKEVDDLRKKIKEKQKKW